ncbi:COG3904 family protein [Pseudodonghicola flavimaris]|uniref:Clp protease n=1 Tax=Pseudodonghicola flavimaris TaxID=3050036 RepID=A0ABT7F351_9RHOB|nr:hypothetical protein [Pseudodonghicola flavimaris]MDK3019036.1 hypothetical protein [Pseudodonghicola flavimaris]
MLRAAIAALLTALPLAAVAQQDDAGLAKFSVDGVTLIYDTETTVEGEEAEITYEDIDRLRALLRDNDGIKVLELNSTGGGVFASEEMARIVIDFGLDTVVSGSCVSSCVNVFLAGTSRRMLLGSKIGFHRRQWSAAAIEDYYESQRESRGWDTPYEFASWVYEDTQAETYKHLAYMISRGVDPAFAIRTKAVSNDDEWYPSRLELFQAGVLTE